MKKYFQLVLVAAVVFGNAQSQTALTLDQCLAIARERSPRLRGVRNAVRATELSHSELLTTKLPQLRLEAAPIYAPFSTRFGYDPALSNGGQIVGQVILQQSLYDAGLRSLKSDQVQLELAKLGKEYRLA